MSRHSFEEFTKRRAPEFRALTHPQMEALAEATHGKREFTFKEAIQVADALCSRPNEKTQAANAVADTLNGRKPNSTALWCYYFGDAYDRYKGEYRGRLLDVMGTTLLNGPEIPKCTGYPDVPHDAEMHVAITHHEETKEFDVCREHYAFQTPKGAKVTTTPVGKKL